MINVEEKYLALSSARCENIETTKKKFGEQDIKSFPKSYPRQIHKLIGEVLTDAYVHNGVAYVQNDRGVTLASGLGTPRHHRMFEALRDKLPDVLTPETFLAGLNMAQRFDCVEWLPAFVKDKKHDISSVIEIGAFLGHKAVRVASDFLNPKGSYHAIELMDDNYEVLAANIAANKLDHIINAHNIGISDVDGPMELYSKGRQRSGIVPIVNVGNDVKGVKDCLSLSTFCTLNNIQNVDFCYITVNGAELKVLEGAESVLENIHCIRIVSKYVLGDQKVSEPCVELLRDNGFNVTQHKGCVDAINSKRIS